MRCPCWAAWANKKAVRISADIRRIRDHISILDQEKQVAESLVKGLREWREQVILLGESDTTFLDRHIRIAKNQVTYIRRRITLLENMADDLQGSVNKTQEILEDTRAYAKKADGIY